MPGSHCESSKVECSEMKLSKPVTSCYHLKMGFSVSSSSWKEGVGVTWNPDVAT